MSVLNYKITVNGKVYEVEAVELTKSGYKTVARVPVGSNPLLSAKAALGSTTKRTRTASDVAANPSVNN
jgi:hypothetical protein